VSDPAGLLLSVRGEERRMVPSDYALVAATIASSRGSKAEAIRAAAAGLDSLTTDLAARGGVALDAGTGRRALTLVGAVGADVRGAGSRRGRPCPVPFDA
jgi:uncharacterized protein (DUF2336 family)